MTPPSREMVEKAKDLWNALLAEKLEGTSFTAIAQVDYDEGAVLARIALALTAAHAQGRAKMAAEMVLRASIHSSAPAMLESLERAAEEARRGSQER